MSAIPALLSMREIFWPEKRVAPDTLLQSSMSVQCRTLFGNFLIRKETVEVVMVLSRFFFFLPGAAQTILKRCHSIWIGFGDRWIMSMLGT